MAPAATSLINKNAVQDHFDGAIHEHACMVTTEISQVPLSGVLQLLKSARKADVPSVLDLDIPPLVRCILIPKCLAKMLSTWERG